jgi:hypothetical protein
MKHTHDSVWSRSLFSITLQDKLQPKNAEGLEGPPRGNHTSSEVEVFCELIAERITTDSQHARCLWWFAVRRPARPLVFALERCTHLPVQLSCSSGKPCGGNFIFCGKASFFLARDLDASALKGGGALENSTQASVGAALCPPLFLKLSDDVAMRHVDRDPEPYWLK